MEGQVNWVSIEEELPAISGYYLVWFGKSKHRFRLKFGPCYFEADDPKTVPRWCENDRASTITHWSRAEEPGV